MWLLCRRYIEAVVAAHTLLPSQLISFLVSPLHIDALTVRLLNCTVMNGSALCTALECGAYYRKLETYWLHISPWIDLKVDFVILNFFLFWTHSWDGCLINNRAWSVEMNAHASSPPSVSHTKSPASLDKSIISCIHVPLRRPLSYLQL